MATQHVGHRFGHFNINDPLSIRVNRQWIIVVVGVAAVDDDDEANVQRHSRCPCRRPCHPHTHTTAVVAVSDAISIFPLLELSLWPKWLTDV